MVLIAQLRWTGHVIRTEESGIPRQIFYSFSGQAQTRATQEEILYKDNLKWPGIQPKILETAAANRSGYKKLVLSNELIKVELPP